MRHYLHYFGPEKLKRAIWCELFVLREGYILYFKKWNRSRDSPVTGMKIDSSGGDPQSDIQHFIPGGSMKVGDSQKSPNRGIQYDRLGSEISNSQDDSQVRGKDPYQ